MLEGGLFGGVCTMKYQYAYFTDKDGNILEINEIEASLRNPLEE